MNNWYRVKRPFDTFRVGQLVSLPGDLRQLGLEQLGFLGNEGPDYSTLSVRAEPVAPAFDAKDPFVTPKRGRRESQAKDRPAEESPVREVSGSQPRGADVPSD